MKIRKLQTKKLYNIGPWCQSYKTFFFRDLLIFVLSSSVCWTTLEKLARDKHSSLVRKSVKLRTKKFYNIGRQVS
jgi:hypothetical protein